MAARNTPAPVLEGSDGAEAALELARPYAVSVTLVGTAPLLFHRWQDADVAAKATAAKGSRAKKTDNVGELRLAGQRRTSSACPVSTCAHASPDRTARPSIGRTRGHRGSQRLDLFKASIVALTDLAPITRVTGDVARTWDYVDSRRAVVQRAGITRMRPAFFSGWSATVILQVLQPPYVPPELLHDTRAACRWAPT